MKVDHKFASRVSAVAAEMMCDGWPHGTFDHPDATFAPDAPLDMVLRRAGHHCWGGPGWWQVKGLEGAERVMRSIRWSVLDAAPALTMSDLSEIHRFQELEAEAKARWEGLGSEGRVFMLLFAGRAVHDQL
jgi:hypothetical protein